MDNDLERSVRLLEDALVTPTKGLFKLSTPKASKRERVISNLSMTLAPDEIRKLLESESVTFGNTMVNLMETDRTITGSVIQGETPWKNTVDKLYVEFANILQGCSGGTEILEITEDLARCCSDALAVVNSLKSTVAIKELEEEKWLENERNNWRLLYVLYSDRLCGQNSNGGEMEQYGGTSEKNCVDELFKREHLVRESQLVIDWLERNALERDDPILHYSDWTYGWEHTLHQLSAPDSIAIGSTVDVIKNIHPDAPHAQNLSLHHLDNANDKKLCQRMFTEIRCGNLEGAQELCCESGHPWRAAMLEGWKLFHNPNTDRNLNAENTGLDLKPYEDIEGNGNRDLWKFSAIEYCRKSELNLHERASVACLCGYLESVLPVCNNWEDYLWAYMKTMVDIRVESEVRDSIMKNYKPLPEEYWEQKLSLSEIFRILESSNNSTVLTESKQIDHIIQKHIILDEIPKLINLLETWVEDSNISTHSLRFFAHLVLFFDNTGEVTGRKSCDKIVEAYIDRLSEMNETQLVAFYVSKLSKRKQVLLYAKHCEKILEYKERELALGYAEDFNLDVFATTYKIVESITNKPTEIDFPGDLQRKVTEIDEVKISSLDWLLFYEEQRSEALAHTNYLVFKFLTLGKLDAAQLALNKIPDNSVEKIRGEEELPEETHQIIKTYLSYKTYLQAHEAFNEWFVQFRNKPTPPADLPETAQFTEKVAHEHKVSQHRAETERWKLTTSHSAETARASLYNVLLFPGGWLLGENDADYLRSVCIPEVVLLLFSVLSESGKHEEVVQLADLIAAEKHALYKVYSKEKLGELLEKICESSVALLNAKKDPFGNPSTA